MKLQLKIRIPEKFSLHFRKKNVSTVPPSSFLCYTYSVLL
ncbi:hypothetical protein HMPREF1986_00769 [Oribacterium sp. oral taxon 078 str. F0263]|nr:hypothetical protein GCWU000341_02392 [Oribacterium sp. oral taxon 078 str. F0262]ERL22163.1 hypothetical protein HMPREF1986_00769 [Oribacterium sp. oral taxon 078 str. F0263]